MRSRSLSTTLLAASLMVAGASAQDSIAKTGCLPGDGVSPYDDAGAPLGSEQFNDYVVDLSPFNTSWGSTFGFAPLIKSSKLSSNFTGSLISAQAMSRLQLKNAPMASSSYAVWNGAGFGINNNPGINDAPATINTTGVLANQFGVAFAEFSNTDLGADYNGVVGGLVSIVPSRPSRLYVSRRVAATNGCDGSDNVSQFGLGSVDESGNLFLRSDGFNTTGAFSSCAPLTNLSGDNIFKVKLQSRSSGARNAVSNDFLSGGAFDLGATEWIIRNATTVFSTPGVLPDPGGTPLFIGLTDTGGANPLSRYVRGPAFGSISNDSAHLAAGVGAHRGNISYSSSNFGPLSSTNGLAGAIGLDSANFDAIKLNVWGLNAAGSVTGALGLTLPTTVTDNDDGYTNIPGLNEFDNYKSQVAFRGGNGQVSMRKDQQNRLLVAAQVVQPDDGQGGSWGWNYIAVARVSADGSSTDWTMAAHCDGASGKAVKSGPGGATIARLVDFSDVIGQGPSLCSPMMDAAGNVWFVGGIEYPDFTTRSAVLRAVYDPANFKYELELVAQTGQVFRGRNSNRDYLITYFALIDSNSIASSAAWSQNINEESHLGRPIENLVPRDERNLGGIILNCGVLYDNNDDGIFEDCSNDPLSPDIDYNVLAYIGFPGYTINRREGPFGQGPGHQ